jgi:hypothetical protein
MSARALLCSKLPVLAHKPYTRFTRVVRMLYTCASCGPWMDLGFSMLDKGIDTYPQHHEKVPIHAGELVLFR